MVRSCMYVGCTSWRGKPLFRFPTKRPKILEAWIRNSGNEAICRFQRQNIHNKYICIDHFDSKFLKNNAQRMHISPVAVPVPYDGSKSESVSQDELKKLAMLRKRLINPAVRLGLFQDCVTQNWGDETGERGHLASETENDQQGPDMVVLKPKKVYHNYHKLISAELAKEKNKSNIRVDGHRCTECERPINGLQWWCLQCGGTRCGKCALRMSHRAHYLLRAPAHATRKQTEDVLAAIRLQMSEDFFMQPQVVRHVDEHGVDLTVTDEPEVKAEPPEVDDLDPLSFNPAVQDDLDPLACIPAQDPLESKPAIEDLNKLSTLPQPSIDQQPESLDQLSLTDLDNSGQISPHRGFVEIYSPVHPGLDTYEMSLAQWSGMDVGMSFEVDRVGVDSHSMEYECPGPEDFSDRHSSDESPRPPSIRRPRVPTHYTYDEDNSQDSIEEIDYEQPTHSHNETDTELIQTKRPWVHVFSSQEQNNTVTIKQTSRTQQPRFQVTSTNEKQNIFAKQQNVQTKKPWVQVFSNIEQKSTDAAKIKNHKAEQSRIADACEEQSSTVPVVKQSEILDSNTENRISKNTAKQKKRIIIVKKRPRGQFAAHIRRDFEEPTEKDNDKTQGEETGTLDINMTTEPTNTLLNLDDYMREKVLEYTSEIEELT